MTEGNHELRTEGVQLTQANFLALFELALQAGWARYDAGKSNLVCMPLFHVAGTNTGLLALLQGVRIVVMKEIDPAAMLRLFEEQQIAYAFLAPTIINMLLQTPGIETTDFSKLERVFYGASPIAEDTLKKAKAVFDADFTQLYGLTETIGAATFLPPEDHADDRGKLRSCGKPWPGYDIRVVTPEGTVGGPLGRLQAEYPDVRMGSYPQMGRDWVMTELVLRSWDAARLAEAAGKVRAMVAEAHAKAGLEPPEDDDRS